MTPLQVPKLLVARADSEGSRISGTGGLFAGVDSSTSRRLAGMALIYGISYIVSFSVDVSRSVAPTPRWHFITAITSIVMSLAIAVAVSHKKIPTRWTINLGALFCFLGGLGLTLYLFGWQDRLAPFLEATAGVERGLIDQAMLEGNISWLCVWLMAYPVFVPLPFRRAVIALVITGSLGVLVPVLSVVFLGMPDAVAPYYGSKIVSATVPILVCLVMGIFGSHIVHGLARDLRRARRLGSYELLDRLGEGGMGEVWKARHRMLVRPAAIKLIRPEALGNAAAVSARDAEKILKRFEREVQTTATLASPHTIQVYDFGMTGEGTFYYVMELLRGFDLRRMVEKFGPMRPERIVHLLRQTCRSLAEAHARGFIHRDIKPANIFACRNGLEFDFAKVLDFGLVKETTEGGTDRTQLTQEGTASGTPAFMPPEMALGKEDLDGRTDLYSLGCVAWWLLTGRLLFEGKTPVEMILRHAKDAPEPPSRVSEMEVSPVLDELVLACLEKEPGSRPDGAAVLERRLGKLADSLPPWTTEHAERWWRTNLPDLVDSPTGTAASAVVRVHPVSE